MHKLFKIVILFLSLLSFQAFAQEPVTSEYLSGRILDINKDENGLTLYQTQLSNDLVIDLDTFGESLRVGNAVYVEYITDLDTYNFITVNRNSPLIVLFLVFVISIMLLAGLKGLRSLGSLGISIILLLMVLVPLLINGYDPIWMTLIFGLCVLFVSIFVTHGFNYQSLVSFIGSFGSILLALFLIWMITKFSSLTGLISDEIQFLSFQVEKTLDLARIVSASIIIGILGVLDDITITQVAVVRELSSDQTLTRKDIFTKALRVGRDHISSLVNTLVFAYVGATLPMIMFVSLLEIPIIILLSQEFIFIEIIRSLIGAIALALAVPLTTWLASYVFLGSIHKDTCTLESACAHHSH
jgi:uncharacterized membrane protein